MTYCEVFQGLLFYTHLKEKDYGTFLFRFSQLLMLNVYITKVTQMSVLRFESTNHRLNWKYMMRV